MMVGISTLWLRYPKSDAPCSTKNKKNFTNQCAIRLGVCLQNSGFNTDRLEIEKCWFHPAKDGHTLRARELARALSRGKVPGVGKREEHIDGVEGFRSIFNRTGIVYFKDWWEDQPGSRGGDHIDLWYGNKTKSHELPNPQEYRPGDGWEYEKGQVWFWPVL